MKRSAELTPLSHDHHQALFVAQRLRRAGDDAVEGFLAFWREHGAHHFVVEEELLLPGWLDADAGAERELAARVAREHLEIRLRARRVAQGVRDDDELRELGELLERHVRFEERELFPLIEQRLEGEALERLGAELAAAEGAG